MKISRRDALAVVPGAMLAATPALALKAGTGSDARLLAMHSAWQEADAAELAAHIAHEEADSRVDQQVKAGADKARSEAQEGVPALLAECRRCAAMTDTAWLAFIQEPAQTPAGLLLKFEAAFHPYEAAEQAAALTTPDAVDFQTTALAFVRRDLTGMAGAS